MTGAMPSPTSPSSTPTARGERRRLSIVPPRRGVGIGNSLHAGQVIVADGTPQMRERLQRVLTNNPAMGVLRHADAGYEEARETGAPEEVRVPVE